MKWNYQLGGALDWTENEIDIVMLELFPAKTMWDDEDYRQACPVIARFFRMLGADGHIPQRQAESLASYVESITDELMLRAMSPEFWAPGKRILRHAGGSAELTEGADLNRIMAEFNALPEEERARITGPMPTAPSLNPLPPITLPATEVLAAEAADARLLGWLRLLVDHVGSGLAITPRGNLKLADGKALNEAMDTGRPWDHIIGDHTYSVRSTVELQELDMVFRVALATGILEHLPARSRVAPGERLDLLDDPLAAVEAAWLAMVDSSTWPPDLDWLGHLVERVWSYLAAVEGEGMFTLNPAGSALRFVDLVSAATDLFGTAAAVEWAEAAAGSAGVEAMLEEAWHLNDERVSLVLGAIGQLHAKKAIAKAARVALFKHNSRGKG